MSLSLVDKVEPCLVKIIHGLVDALKVTINVSSVCVCVFYLREHMHLTLLHLKHFLLRI